MKPTGISRRGVIGAVGAASLALVATRAVGDARTADEAAPGSRLPAAPASTGARNRRVTLTADTTAVPTAPGDYLPPLTPPSGVLFPVPNAGFEVASADGTPAQWTVITGSAEDSAVISTAQAHSGDSSLLVSHPVAGAGFYIESAQFPATPGQTYTATGWVYGVSGSGVWLYVAFADSSGALIDDDRVEPSFSMAWQQVSVSGVAPEGAASVFVLIYAGSVAGTAYWDDITLASTYIPALGTGSELFVDSYRIASTSQVQRVVHPGAKSGILLRPDQPWESDIVYLYGGAIWDSLLREYRMWYTAIDSAGAVSICYADSPDGIHWTKPDLGLVTYDGSTANNIVIASASDSACYGVILDTSDSDATRRYKMLSYQDGVGYCAYFSPDGLTWTAYDGNPVIAGADVANVSYDEARGQFIATTKQPPYDPRTAWVSVSSDFTEWTEPVLAVQADAIDVAQSAVDGGVDAQIYGAPAFAYGNSYLALPWVFWITDDGDSDGTIAPEIAGSRDLINWDRPARNPVIPLGEAGTWDQGMVFTASAPIVSDREVVLYYGGWNGTHASATRGASIGRVTWQRDRFVSLSNGGDYEGTVTTPPVTFSGSSMWVNASARPGGYVRVEVLDAATSDPVTGYAVGDAVAVRGDSLAARVRWAGNPGLAALAGQQVAIRFHLLNADLYSFRIA